ncbi:MAG: endonuclease/exonuclease/phosphatase family protein [Anaerolineae bacterium]
MLQRMWKRVQRGALALTLLYSAVVHGWLLLRWLTAERSGLVALANTFAEWLLLPALGLLPFTRRRHWPLLSLPLALLLAWYAPRFIPRARKAAPDVPTLTVLTHNLLADPHPLDAIIAALRASSADIIALQEVSQAYEPLLIEGLRDVYPYFGVHTVALRFAGQAIFSRYPLLEDDYWQYEWLPTPLGHQRALIDTPYTPVVVYNVHPTHPGMNGQHFNPAYRHREIQDVMARIHAETLPVVLLGDFNMPENSPDYQTVTATLTDAYRDVGLGIGWTFRLRLPFPFLRLDYVFCSAEWLPLTAEVLPEHGGSDHYPVRVALAWRGAPSIPLTERMLDHAPLAH